MLTLAAALATCTALGGLWLSLAWVLRARGLAAFVAVIALVGLALWALLLIGAGTEAWGSWPVFF